MHFDDLPDIMSVAQVAAALNCSEASVYARVREGKIKFFRFGRLIRILKSELLTQFSEKPEDGDGTR